MKKIISSFLFIFLAISSFACLVSKEPMLNAMQSEIKRSMPIFKKQKPPIYFISYMITSSKKYSYSSSLGKIENQNISEDAVLDIDVRVGSEKMDNTRPLKGYDLGWGGQTSTLALLSPDEKVLKSILWQATESAVKKAQSNYEKVKSNAASVAKRTDDSDDFSAPLPKKTNFCAELEPFTFNEQEMIDLINEYSALFKGKDFILSSRVYFTIDDKVVYFVDSQDNKMKRPQRLMRLG